LPPVSPPSSQAGEQGGEEEAPEKVAMPTSPLPRQEASLPGSEPTGQPARVTLQQPAPLDPVQEEGGPPVASPAHQASPQRPSEIPIRPVLKDTSAGDGFPALASTEASSSSPPSSPSEPESLAAESSKPPSPASFPVTRVVQEGDYLSKLAVEVYGFVNDALIAWIIEQNPQIEDANRILVGEKILFPALPESFRSSQTTE
ncbi:MAG: hypothetical protein D6736_14515, partial [Nitrospinota bacterium]